MDSYGLYASIATSNDIVLSDKTALTLSGGLSYAFLHQDAFSESGAGDLNFDVDRARAESLETTVGMDLDHEINTKIGHFDVLGFARYHYDALASKNREHAVSFSNPFFGDFVQSGQNRGAHGMTLGMGATGQINDHATFSFGYARTWNSHGAEDSFGATLALRW